MLSTVCAVVFTLPTPAPALSPLGAATASLMVFVTWMTLAIRRWRRVRS